MRQSLCLALFLTLAGCSGETAVTPDGGGGTDGGRDAGDSGNVDATALDAGEVDAGEVDGGAGDAGAVDAGRDAGSDAGPPPFTEPVDDGTVLLPHTHPSCAPAVGFAADGTTFLAHSVPAPGAGVRVARLAGRTWVAVGGLLNDADQVLDVNICPAMVVTADGTPYVGFVSASTTTRQVRVRRFLAGAWETVLSIDRPIADFAPALGLDMALDAADMPIVALIEYITADGEHFATVRRLVGGAFVAEGGPVGRSGRGVRVVGRTDGTISVFHTRQSGFGLIGTVSTVSGGVWTSLPDVSATDSSRPLIPNDLDADATSIVASWSEVLAGGGGFVARTARSTGAAFSELDGPPEAGSEVSTLIGGATLVQVYASDIAIAQLRVFDGAAWGTPIALPFGSVDARIAGPDGALHIAYGDGGNARLVRVNLP
jgi:hypothetical protein